MTVAFDLDSHSLPPGPGKPVGIGGCQVCIPMAHLADETTGQRSPAARRLTPVVPRTSGQIRLKSLSQIQLPQLAIAHLTPPAQPPIIVIPTPPTTSLRQPGLTLSRCLPICFPVE